MPNTTSIEPAPGLKRIFLTGGTGFLGSAIAYQLAQKGFALTLLVRSSRLFSGKEKFVRAVRVLFPNPDLALIEKRIEFLQGDILHENFGLPKTDRTWDLMVHSAAVTDFNAAPEVLRQSNVEGVRLALQFAKKHRIPSFHHISTAYSVGNVTGAVFEKLHDSKVFRNLYEETKCQAEHLAADFCRSHGIRLTIYRPSIIVGETREGRTLNFEGPYLFLKLSAQMCRFARLKQILHPQDRGFIKLNIHVPFSDKEVQNLVPVDYVASFVCESLLRPEFEGGIYHLTNFEPPTVHQINEACKELLHFDGLHFDGEGSSTDNTKEQTFFSEKLAAYWPYLKVRMNFDKTNAGRLEKVAGLASPVIAEATLRRLFEYALKTHFGKRVLGDYADSIKHGLDWLRKKK